MPNRQIRFYFQAYESTSVDIPVEFSEDSNEWTLEQWDRLQNLAEEEIRGTYAEWEISDIYKPEIEEVTDENL